MCCCIRSNVVAGHEAEEEVAKVNSKLGGQAGMAAKFRAMAAAEAAYESSHGLQERGGGNGSLRLLRQQFVRLVRDNGCFVVLNISLLMLFHFFCTPQKPPRLATPLPGLKRNGAGVTNDPKRVKLENEGFW